MLNSQARDYFTRHMRILEHCIPIASPEMQAQINSLREAFSLDPSQPFELKPTLSGMRSPSTEKQLTPPISQQTTPNHTTDSWPQLQAQSLPNAASPLSEYGNNFAPSSVSSITSHPTIAFSGQQDAFNLTPTSGYAQQPARRYPGPTSASLHTDNQFPMDPVSNNELQTPVWDPSGIFNQWHTAFGNPVAPPNSSPTLGEPRMLSQAPTSNPVMAQGRPIQRTPPAQAAMYTSPHMSPTAQSAIGDDQIPGVPTVTSMMWQNAFTDAYISGHKRTREDGLDDGMYGQYQTKRRA